MHRSRFRSHCFWTSWDPISSAARLRRRIRASTVAERARISRTTLHKIERGDAGVSIGKYTSVLHVLGLHAGVGNLADRSLDSVGLDVLEESLPKRVRVPRGAG